MKFRIVVEVETDGDAAGQDVINALFEVGCVYPVAKDAGGETAARINNATVEQV